MISFVISAFNRPLALRTCLSSLVQQTHPDIEVLVVDNSDSSGMSDGNADECEMYSSFKYLYTGRVTEIEDTMHKYSLYKATEIGVSQSTGDWLCFPNDDSYYCPWFAERMLHAAEKNNWDLVYCDIVMGGSGGHHVLEAAPKRCCIDKTNFLLRRDWFQGFSHGHDEDYPQADGFMIEELVRRGIRHGRVPEVLVVHN